MSKFKTFDELEFFIELYSRYSYELHQLCGRSRAMMNNVINNFPENKKVKGIYFLYDEDRNLVYVGKSKDIKVRLFNSIVERCPVYLPELEYHNGISIEDFYLEYSKAISKREIKYYRYMEIEIQSHISYAEENIISHLQPKFNVEFINSSVRDNDDIYDMSNISCEYDVSYKDDKDYITKIEHIINRMALLSEKRPVIKELAFSTICYMVDEFKNDYVGRKASLPVQMRESIIERLLVKEEFDRVKKEFQKDRIIDKSVIGRNFKKESK